MRRTLFTEAHEAFRATVRAFLEAEVVPEYPSWVVAGRPSRTFWTGAADLGILGIGVPPRFGGLVDSSFTHSVVVTEEIQRLGLALGGLRVHTDICVPYFLTYATPDQQERWLPRLTAGEAVVALGLSEPGAGSDLKAMSTSAVRDGDHLVVNGAKTFISNGAAADLVVLAVRTDAAAGRHGLSLLVVETDTPGFTRGRKLAKLGLAAQDLAELSFTDMRVPVENLLGTAGEGFTYLTSHLAQERLSIAVNSQAAAVATLDGAVRAAGPASQHVKFELAACRAQVEAGQSLVDRAVAAHERDALSAADAALTKLFCTELQGTVADRCLRLAGRDGLVAGNPAATAYLDGRVSRVYGGSSEIMKVIVAKSLGL